MQHTPINCVQEHLQLNEVKKVLFFNIQRLHLLDTYRLHSNQIDILCFDDFYLQKFIQFQKEENTHYNLILDAFIPKHKQYDDIIIECYQNTPHEFLREQIELAFQHLNLGGKLYVMFEKYMPIFQQFCQKTFKHSSLYQFKKMAVLVAKKTIEKIKLKQYTYTQKLNFSFFDLQITTVPGVFCHRKVDEGCLALSEVAEVKDGDTLLDMGCGSGLAGIALNLKAKNLNTTFLDSHARAIYCSKTNCELNHIEHVSFKLKSVPFEVERQYDVIVANPPYFAHDEISNSFIQNAYDLLKESGNAYFVAKASQKLEERCRPIFNNILITERRGYEVIHVTKHL